MAWYGLVLFVLTPLLVGGEAGQLYCQMAADIEKAATLDVAFEVTVDRGAKEEYRGSLLVARGNRMRAEMREVTAGAAGGTRVVSDGTKVWADDQVGPATPPPGRLTEGLLASFGRAGVYPTMFRTEVVDPAAPPGNDDPVGRLRASGFRLRGKERVGARTAVVVEYEMQVGPGPGANFGITVWIDAETHLPLKRVVACEEDGKTVMVTETYTRVVVNGEVAPKAFDLPRGK
jgi:outer membrane lipoprotein-sorting protein